MNFINSEILSFKLSKIYFTFGDRIKDLLNGFWALSFFFNEERVSFGLGHFNFPVLAGRRLARGCVLFWFCLNVDLICLKSILQLLWKFFFVLDQLLNLWRKLGFFLNICHSNFFRLLRVSLLWLFCSSFGGELFDFWSIFSPNILFEFILIFKLADSLVVVVFRPLQFFLEFVDFSSLCRISWTIFINLFHALLLLPEGSDSAFKVFITFVNFTFQLLHSELKLFLVLVLLLTCWFGVFRCLD